MSYIFLYVERGIFVEGYILNSDVLCFTQDIDDEKKVLIVEKNKKLKKFRKLVDKRQKI